MGEVVRALDVHFNALIILKSFANNIGVGVATT